MQNKSLLDDREKLAKAQATAINRNEVNRTCYEPDCMYNPGGLIRPHYHVHTANGSYVKYIVEKK